MQKIIIDVRSSEEYSESHKENAINIPVDAIYNKTEYAKNILANISLDTSIEVYCFSGSRAHMAQQLLKEMWGYTSVRNTGGLHD